MLYKHNYVIIGGDERLAYAAQYLKDYGHDVSAYANDAACGLGAAGCAGLRDAMSGERIIFGIPFSRDGETVFAPLGGEKISIEDVIAAVEPSHVIFGGKFGDFMLSVAKRGAKCHDYLLREDFALYNADVTAEAVVSVLMNNLPVILKGTRCLVMGYGRIGKSLSDKLAALGADVTVSARKCADFAAITLRGYESVRTGEKIDNARKYDFIVNTIPHKVLGITSFAELRKDCLVVDASAYPGFVDAAEAEINGIKVMGAFSLPGKYAPMTSGRIIADVTENIDE